VNAFGIELRIQLCKKGMQKIIGSNALSYEEEFYAVAGRQEQYFVQFQCAFQLIETLLLIIGFNMQTAYLSYVQVSMCESNCMEV
jgi:hypothetical protein